MRPETSATAAEANVLSWEQLEPALDEAMERLSESDRRLIVMRYFERRGYDEVCAATGVSEAAAMKRRSRAIEKLRGYLAKRGVIGSTSTLGAIITEHAIRPAAPHVITAASEPAAASAVAADIAKGVRMMQSWAKVKVAAALLLVVAIAGAAAAAAVAANRSSVHGNAPGARGDSTFVAMW
jgi:hypothetical protein